MNKSWISGAMALFSVLVFFGSVGPVSAAPVCQWQCTSGQIGGNNPATDQLNNCFEGGCRQVCDTNCASIGRGGCRAWTCDGRTTDGASGDLCATQILNTTPEPQREGKAAEIGGMVTSPRTISGQWSCRPTIGTDAVGTNCVDPISPRPSDAFQCGSGLKCCAPNAAVVSCASRYLSTGGTQANIDALIANTRPGITANELSCTGTGNADERRILCVGDSAACPGRPNNFRCCIPPDAEGGFNCSAGASPASVTALEAASRTTRNAWFCQQMTAANRNRFCVAGSTLCGRTYQCCIPTSAQATVAAREAGIAAPAANCAERAVNAQGVTTAELTNKIRTLCGGTDCPNYAASTWTCARACQASPTRDARCVSSGCTQGIDGGDDASGVLCCAPQSGFPAVTAQNVCRAGGSTGTTTSTAGAAGSSASGGGIIGGRIALPACISTGRCTLDDLLRTGASFANFLLELSGALFLLIFVYAGFRYLLALGDEGVVKSSKDMLRNAAIGMIIIIGASTLVRYVYATFTAPEQALTSVCYARFGDQGFDCRYIPGDNDDEIKANVSSLGCKAEVGMCNLQGQDRNFRCCPFTGGPSAP